MELCVKCDRPTGRSGAAEDSLMITGHPYCEPCYEETLPEAVDYLDGRCGTLAAQLRERDAIIDELLVRVQHKLSCPSRSLFNSGRCDCGLGDLCARIEEARR